MSFPVPIAYNITDDHNTEVIYGNGDTLDLIRTMIDIPADLVLKYEEFTPDHDITSSEQMRIKLLPEASTVALFALDDIPPNANFDSVYLIWLAMWNRERQLVHLRATRVVQSDGIVGSKTFISFDEATKTIFLPTTPTTILPANKKYAVIQIKMGLIEV